MEERLAPSDSAMPDLVLDTYRTSVRQCVSFCLCVSVWFVAQTSLVLRLRVFVTWVVTGDWWVCMCVRGSTSGRLLYASQSQPAIT